MKNNLLSTLATISQKFYLFIVCFLVLLLSIPMQAQEWQWGKSGGSPVAGLEEVRDMAVDQNGNLYFLARFQGEFEPMLDGIPLPHYGATDYVIASYTCEGALRWKKVIGGYSHDNPQGIGIDTLGNVTVIGRSALTQVIFPPPLPSHTNVHFDTDTILDWVGTIRYYIIRYDTAGVFQWLKMPGPGQNPSSQEVFRSLNVEPNGNFHFFAALDSGSVYSSVQFPVNETGFYVMQYNVLGEQIGLIPLDIKNPSNSILLNMNMAYCPLYQQYYIAGSVNPNSSNLVFGSDTISSSMYAAALSAQGEYLWALQGDTFTNPAFGFKGKISVCDQGNIFIAGIANELMGFSGFNPQNNYSSGTLPILVKIAPNGELTWGRNGHVTSVTNAYNSILSGDYVYVTGQFPGTLYWDEDVDVLMLPPNALSKPFLSKFNKETGESIAQSKIEGLFGHPSSGRALAADGHGYVYLGGQFTGQLYIGSDTLQHMGGQSDFFFARYGEECPCDLPVAAYTAETQAGSLWASFNFAGLNTDSLQWSFGDGNFSNQENAEHAYASAGTYEVCLTVWNTCGEEVLCDSITIVCELPDPQFSYTTSETGATLHLNIPDTNATAAIWDFGDGQTGEGIQVSHTFDEEGTYQVCATVTSPCGTQSHCEEITIQFVSTSSPGIFSEVNIFPNPTRHVLHLHNLPEGTQYRLYNITGQEMALPENPAVLGQNTVLNIRGIPAGSYILRLQSSTGESRNFMVLVGA